MSHPFLELPLPEAIKEIKKRLYPDLKDEEALQKIADEAGVKLRSAYDWQMGNKGTDFKHARKLREIARRANLGITTDSMLRRGWGSAPRRQK